MTQLHSFDVFDTALVRRVAFPSDVFFLVGERIAGEIGKANYREFIEDFVSARRQAERVLLLEHEETTLADIWVALRDTFPELPPSCGSEYELNAEREVLGPNREIARHITSLRAEGARIAFASDTYLPREFVWDELTRHGLAIDGDHLYVSSSLGVTKRSGKLFDRISKSEGVPADKIHHYGDNAHSDFNVPKRLGVQATLLSDAQLNQWEQALCGTEPKMASSLLAGSMRSFRLNNSSDFPESICDLVGTFLGPIAMVWAAWLLGAARRDGVRRLYFASRDGNLVWHAARMLSPQFGDIDCRYLKVSRQAVLLPSVKQISPSEIPWLFRPWELAEMDRLLQKLGLNWAEVSSSFETLANGQGRRKILDGKEDLNEFWKVLQTSTVKDLLLARIEERRKAALAYFEAEGLGDEIPSGFVDLGWFLTVQTALRKLLGGREGKSRLRGYYLGVSPDRLARSEAGDTTALFYGNAPDRRELVRDAAIFRRIDILEHIIGLAPHGTVHEYRFVEGVAEPVCRAIRSDYADSVRDVERAVRAFCRIHPDAESFADEHVARSTIDVLIKTWCGSPSEGALKLLQHVRAGRDQNNLDDRRLVEPWRLWEAAKVLLPGRLQRAFDLKLWSPMWPEASLKCSQEWPSRLVRFRTKLNAVRSQGWSGFDA